MVRATFDRLRSVGERTLFPGNWLWCSIAAVFVIDSIWLAVSDRLSLAPTPLILVGLLAVLSLAIGLRRSTINHWIRDAAVGGAFIMLAFVALKTLDYLLMSARFPLADDLLDSWDRALGFDWRTYAETIAQHDWAASALRFSYQSLSRMSVVLFALLFYFKGADRAAEFVRLFFVTAAVSTIVGAFFPCIGVTMRYGSPELAAVFGPDAGTYYIEPLQALRSYLPYELDLRSMPGLVEFPSFHTASAIIMAFVCRGLGGISWLATILAGLIVAATPLMGGHYFVDLIAGTILAVGAAAYEIRRRPRRQAALQTAEAR